MRFGLNIGTSAEHVKLAADAGFDYVETGFSVLAQPGDETLDSFCRALADNHIRCEAVNCFIPGSMKVVGDAVDSEALKAYVERGMSRAARAGTEIVVFGSGGARSIPDGFSYPAAVKQLTGFLREIVSPIAGKYGVTVVIEPLCDTNSVTTVREGAMLAAAADTEPVKLLCDLYHMYRVGDGLDTLTGLEGFLKHSHIAEPVKRGYPLSGQEYDYRAFVKAVEALGCPRCTVEASPSDMRSEAPICAKLLKSL